MSKILYRLKLYKNGEVVAKATRKRKMTLLSFAKANFSPESKLKADTIYLKVLYGKGNVNEGYYSNLKEFTQAYQAFTEQSLINYIREVI